MNEVSAQQIAHLISGRIVGDPNVKVSGPSKIDDSQEGTISFLANPKYESYIYDCLADIVLVSESFEPKKELNCTLIHVPNVYESLAVLMDTFGAKSKEDHFIASQACIHDTVQIGDNVHIEAFVNINRGSSVGADTRIYSNVSIGANVKIGSNTIIYPGVRIYDNCEIGNDVILHANVVIGADGFGFSRAEDGSYKKINHLGNVIIKDKVEIGANTTVDRGSIGSTVIGEGVKLDNLIQVAHNVEIGKNTVIAAQTGIAGSAKLGESNIIGGQVGIAGHKKIGNRIQVQAQTGIIGDIKDDARLSGSPAIEYANYYKSYAAFKNLPDLLVEIRKMKQKLAKLEDASPNL